MERMFLNPETGEIHPESYYRHENIDLDCVIERVEDENTVGYLVQEEFIDRYRVRSESVFNLFRTATMNMLMELATPNLDEERHEEIRNALIKIAKAMLRNLEERKKEEQQKLQNLH